MSRGRKLPLIPVYPLITGSRESFKGNYISPQTATGYRGFSNPHILKTASHMSLSAMPWQIVLQVAKRYFPQILLPITITVGFIGYSIETYIRPPQPAEKSKSVSEIREERRLRKLDSNEENIRWKLLDAVIRFYLSIYLLSFYRQLFDLSGSNLITFYMSLNRTLVLLY